MKTIIIVLFFSLYFTSLSAQTYFYAESISISPVNPTDQDPITITVSGNLSSSASQVDSTNFTISGTELSLKLYCSTGIGMPVLTSHSEPIQIGILDAGDYHINLSGPGLGNFVADTTQLYFSVTSTSSTQYFPFIEENKIWSELTESWGNYWTTFYKFEGDTSFNNTSYKKVFISNDSLMLQWSPDNYSYYREDDSGKVYQYSTISNEEILLYDFSVQQGDILNIQGMQVTADIVDSALINGEYRKRIIFEDMISDTWIEGIGSLTGPFRPFENNFVADIYFELLCVEQDFNLIYQKPGADVCYVYIVDVAEHNQDKSDQIRIFPQPARDFVTIQLANPDQRSFKVEIVDIYSDVIAKFTVTGDKSILNTSSLKPGIYVVRVSNGFYTLQQKMIVSK